MDVIQRWLHETNAVMLYYFLGTEDGYVFVVTGNGKQPRVEKLTASDKLAETLGVKPGPLNADQIRTVLALKQANPMA